MNAILEIAITNAAAAGGLAILVFAITRLVCRPALACGLWLLVLARLVVPPLWTIPMGEAAGRQDISGSRAESHGPLDPRVGPVTQRLTAEHETLFPEANLAGDAALRRPTSGSAPSVPDPQVTLARPSLALATQSEAAVVRDPDQPFPWSRGLIMLWLAGTVSFAALAVARTVRFQRLVRRLDPGPAWLQVMADELAQRFGLPRSPAVRVAPGRIAPLLWVCGRAVLVLPAELLAALPREEQRMLVAHELAHYRRRDHLVRWFEAIVAALYWWHPAVWWARRELRRAEEACCDAWVLWAVPGGEREYARLLLDTLDFLCGARTVRPALASGFGPANGLRRRLHMILHDTAARRLSRPARLGLAVAGLLVLAVTVVRGQTQPDARPVADPLAPPPASVEAAALEPLPAETPGAPVEPAFRASQSAAEQGLAANEPDPPAPLQPGPPLGRLDRLPVDESEQSLPAIAPPNESAAPSAAAPIIDSPLSATSGSARAGDQADQESNVLHGIPVGSYRPQKIASALLAALQDQDVQVRSSAAFALGQRGQRSDEVITALARMLREANEPGEVRTAAVAIGQLAKPSSESLDALIQGLRHGDRAVREKVRAAVLETSTQPTQDVIDALVGALRHQDDGAQKAVRSALREVGGFSEQVVKSLAAAIDSDNAALQKDATAALSDLVAVSSRVVDALIEALQHKNPGIRSAAVRALGTTGSLLPSEKLVDALIQASKSDDTSVRRAAVLALGRVGKPGPDWNAPHTAPYYRVRQ